MLADGLSCKGGQPIAETSNRLVVGHGVPGAVGVAVEDRPALGVHPAAASNHTQDRAAGRGVVVGIPAEVEGQSKRRCEVASAEKQRCNRRGGVQLVAILVAHRLAAVARIAVADTAADGLPIVRLGPTPVARSADDGMDLALGIDGCKARCDEPFGAIFEVRRRDHGGSELSHLRRLAVDSDMGVMQSEARSRSRHPRRDKRERLGKELAGDVEVGPWVDRDPAGQRRCQTQVHQVARVPVRAPDSPVDVPLPECGDLLRGQSESARALHRRDVDPLDIGIVIGPGALGQGGRVRFDAAWLGDVLHLVRQAIQVSEQLAKEATAEFVVQRCQGDLADLGWRFRTKLGGEACGEEKGEVRHCRIGRIPGSGRIAWPRLKDNVQVGTMDRTSSSDQPAHDPTVASPSPGGCGPVRPA